MLAERDKILMKLRREQVAKILQKERENMHKKYEAQQQQQFANIYPHITEDNFHQHRYILAQLVVNPKYVYQIVPLSGLVYQFLIEHPDDFDSILILKYVSEYEDVRIPQTQQFADIVMGLMKGKSRFDVLLICANLLESGRYQLLRDHLIQAGFIQRVSQFMEQSSPYNDEDKNKLTMIMVTQILSIMMSTHPLIKLQQIETILRVIKKTLKYEQQKWALFDSMTVIRQKQKHNKRYAKLLIQQLQPIMVQQRFGSQIPILNLLIYAGYSGVYSKNEKLLGLITQVIKNNAINNTTNALDLALDCASLYLDDGGIDLDGQLLWNLLLGSNNINRKQSILKVISSLDQQSLMTSLITSQQRQQIIDQLIDSIQIKQTEYLTTQIILKLSTEDELRIQLQSLGLVKIVERIYEQCRMEDCQHLQQLLDMFANNNEDD